MVLDIDERGLPPTPRQISATIYKSTFRRDKGYNRIQRHSRWFIPTNR